MGRLRKSTLASVALAGLLTLVAPSAAIAHGTEEIGGIEWVVGWAEEPAFVGFKNAVQLRLSRGGEPIEGAEQSLKVVVSLGDIETEPLALRPTFESPGEYLADLIPTAPGDYIFRFIGVLGEKEVDETFVAAEFGFDRVQGTDAVAFPNPAPPASQLADLIEAVDEKAEAAGPGAALPVSVVALVLAIVGLGGLRTRRNSR